MNVERIIYKKVEKKELIQKIKDAAVDNFIVSKATGDLGDYLETLRKLLGSVWFEYYKLDDGWYFGHRIKSGLGTILSSDLDIGPLDIQKLIKDVENCATELFIRVQHE